MKTIFTIVATVATVSSFAQDVKFGKLSKQDFEKTKSSIQADAPAEETTTVDTTAVITDTTAVVVDSTTTTIDTTAVAPKAPAATPAQ